MTNVTVNAHRNAQTVNPITIYRHTKGEWYTDTSGEQFYRYYLPVEDILSEGDVLTFSVSSDENIQKQYTFSDGKFTNNDDSTDVIELHDEYLMNNFTLSHDQYDNHWDQVGDYTVSVFCNPFLEKVADKNGESCISILENFADSVRAS